MPPYPAFPLNRSNAFNSKIEGKKVNGLIYPNLESANISYKLLKELNKIESVGPLIMGLNKSVHLLQLHASVDEMVNMITAQRAYEINSKSIQASDEMLQMANNLKR